MHPQTRADLQTRDDRRLAWWATLGFLGMCLAGGLLLLPPVQDALLIASQALADSMAQIAVICR